MLLPLALLWLFVLTVGVVAVSSALAVRIRDITNALPFLLQVGVFLAPIGYSPSRTSQSAMRVLVGLNPLTGIIEASRWMLLSGYHPSVEPIVVSLVLSGMIAIGRLASVRPPRAHYGRRDLMATTTHLGEPPIAVTARGLRKQLSARGASEP